MRRGLLEQPGSRRFAALVVLDVWEWTPFIALMVLAGLQAARRAQFEAAQLDGCGPLQLYCYVMLPMLRPSWSSPSCSARPRRSGEFDQVYILTGGGPGSSTTVNDLFQYRVSFTAFDMSYGAALGVTTFVVVTVLSWVLFRFLSRRGSL